MRARLKVYSAFIRIAFLDMLAYRLRYYTGILTYLLLVSVQYFIWQAVFANRPEGSTIHGFSLAEMVTYISIGWISRSFYFSDIDNEINSLVTTGQMSVYLLRPVNFQLMMITHAIGESLFRITFFSLPVALVIFFVFPVEPPAGLFPFLLFCISTTAGFFVLAQLNFIIGLLSFYLKSIDGIMRAKYYFVQLCSGLLLPLAFFPGYIRQLLELLPFQAIASLPLQLYLGRVSRDALIYTFGVQAFWLVTLYFIGRYLWGRALAKLTLQGG